MFVGVYCSEYTVYHVVFVLVNVNLSDKYMCNFQFTYRPTCQVAHIRGRELLN